VKDDAVFDRHVHFSDSSRKYRGIVGADGNLPWHDGRITMHPYRKPDYL
jgi:hypothetical protein